MTYAGWEPRHRVTTIAPGKLDLFVATYIDGKRASIQPITEYEDALAKARAFLLDHKCQIKVLPLSGLECRNLLGIAPAQSPEPISPVVHQEIVETLERVIRESSDGDARADALDLLKTTGGLDAVGG